MVRTLRRAALVLGIGCLGLVACKKVPFTNRLQYNLVPDGLMNSLGQQSYVTMLQGTSLVHGTPANGVMNRVGQRISVQANQPRFQWEYSLINEPVVNAWCLPGGKIAFYTGILPVLRSEAGMAFVMGHEVGHAVARHGAERMTQQLTLLGGLTGLELFLSAGTKVSPENRALIMGAIGLGAEVGMILPFSRAHESEADVMGLMYMSGAGYPPEESIEVWERMGEVAGEQPPAFLSTHPSHAQRQKVLTDWMGNARKRYERNRLSGNTLAPLWTSGGSAGASTAPASGSSPAPAPSPRPSTKPKPKP